MEIIRNLLQWGIPLIIIEICFLATLQGIYFGKKLVIELVWLHVKFCIGLSLVVGFCSLILWVYGV